MQFKVRRASTDGALICLSFVIVWGRPCEAGAKVAESKAGRWIIVLHLARESKIPCWTAPASRWKIESRGLMHDQVSYRTRLVI